MGTFLPSNIDNGVDTSDATATASKILNGYTAYANGVKVTGDAMATASTADASKILNGYTAYDNSGTAITGSAMATASTATAAQILSGYTAYTNLGMLLTGSYTPPTAAKTYDIIAQGAWWNTNNGTTLGTTGFTLYSNGTTGNQFTTTSSYSANLSYIQFYYGNIKTLVKVGYYIFRARPTISVETGTLTAGTTVDISQITSDGRYQPSIGVFYAI